ncbi:putative C6 transcription factor [Aspergillus alliaceus]|uniref:Putative C6 transcription factor n=1 Tax=Petromyces alliaceus TaxID=209559 RepID=A0A5N7BZY0_PETAA|nr:putative C6 transcription factor [Aspergillus alliaceus]KAB8238696.1 putative C6 transcription factor [Aspergillus alliaceus]KAE8387402.1 putative C6 transcription factor [Aspergillus alliaceus]
MQDPTTPSKPPSSRPPSSLACVPCRRRHLKCDALMPTCTRCQSSNIECRYVRSRRGLRTKHENHHPQRFAEEMLTAEDFAEWLNATTLATDLEADPALLQGLDTPPVWDVPCLQESTTTWPAPEPLPTTAEIAYDPMVQLYYQNFHRSHPFLVPRKILHSSLRHQIPPYIPAIMRYIGAHYYPDARFKEEFRPAAHDVLLDSTPRDGFKVQGLLLLAILEHAHGQEETARLNMQTAIELALELGMNRSNFSRVNSQGSSVLAESWRRTYWELYVVDGLLAAMRDQSSFRLFSQKTDVQLPCAETLYNSAREITPTAGTLEDLNEKWSMAQDSSTFKYRIEAARNLGLVMEINRSLDINLEARVETVDAMLVSSLMQLPSSQNNSLDSSNLDEMLFQAEMIDYLAIIYLHHPRSSMRFASFQARTWCTRLRICNTNPAPTDLDLHSHKFLRAADQLSNLVTLPSAIKSRTPFFTCALAMCVIVHTAACLINSTPDKVDSLKARIQLSIGGLNMLGKSWPLAKMVRQQMVNMYQEVGLR